MQEHELLLQRRNIRWCSDAIEVGCDNREKVRVALRPTAAIVRRWAEQPKVPPMRSVVEKLWRGM